MPPGVRYEERKPQLPRQARHRPATSWVPRWRVPLIGAAVVLLAVLLAVRVWMEAQPPTPDANALHADIASGRSGVEVTFVASVVAPPAGVGDHEQIEVQDGLGDQLELDYNTQLGQWIPAKVGDRLTVHGRLYIDPGRVGVHCLHQLTSSGCPLPGWIQLGGQTYS